MMRVVLDTNVLVSGLMRGNTPPGLIVDAWQRKQVVLVLSAPILDEVQRALAYPKVRSRIRRTDAELEAFLRQMELESDIVGIGDIGATVPGDPQDNAVLATLIAGHADFLVTGDADLLALRDRYPVVTPAEFWEKHGGL